MDPKTPPNPSSMAGVPWLGRGRGLQLQDLAVGQGRGLLLGLGRAGGLHPPPATAPPGRGVPGPPGAAGDQLGVGGLGRGAGLFLPTSQPTVGLGRGALLTSLEPQERQEPPSKAITQRPLTEESPVVKEVDMPTLGPTSMLASMFRGMGIESSMSSFGRGAQPVGRGAAAVRPEGLSQREEAVGRGSSLQEQGLRSPSPPALGGAAMHQVSFGRGSTLLPPPTPCPAEPLPPAAEHQATPGTMLPKPSSEKVEEPSATPPPTTEPKKSVYSPALKVGMQGSPATIFSNHVPISCKNEAVYQYHVTFTPSVESMGMRYGMMKEHRSVTGEVTAFDGAVLYLPVELKEVILLQSVRRTDNQEIEIKIQLIKVLPPSAEQCLSFYNVVLKRALKAVGLKLVGRNYYNPNDAVILGQQRMQVWPGYSSSIKVTDGGMYLCVDVSHKVLRNDSVLDIMNLVYRQKKESFQDECVKELVGSIVITRYNNRTYRIDGIEWSKSPRDTFTLMDGTNTSFVEYYSKNYGITIKEMDQPLLLHRPKERSKPGGKQIITGEILLVPELSFMTGIPEKMRKDMRAMKDLSVHIKNSADQQAHAIKQLLSNIITNPESMSELSRWGLAIRTEMLMIEGRALPGETIYMHSSNFPAGPDLSWSRDVTRTASISCIPMNVWAIFFPRRVTEQVEELVSTFKKVATGLGMRLERPMYLELKDDRTETYIKSIQNLLSREPNTQLIVTIITGDRDDLYAAIKKLCCVKCPVPSQVINARTISQPHKLRSVAQKILLQINCKLGGELWSVGIPLKRLMIVGVDVHHDTGKMHRSVMGFVASLNNSLTRWYSRVRFQSPTEEMIKGFTVCFLAALQKYHELNHSFPDKIFVYRDGVSDSQLATVEHYEIPQLIKSFETFPNYEPKLVFIVVRKRISTTLFSHGTNYGPPAPGTVLDHTLTLKERMDFFLMAHQVRQGCGLPTHYVTLFNQSNLSADHLQRLTFKLCHMYWNWPGTIRVPAPCKYAHRLAFLSGQYLHADPAIQLSDKLFFL